MPPSMGLSPRLKLSLPPIIATLYTLPLARAANLMRRSIGWEADEVEGCLLG